MDLLTALNAFVRVVDTGSFSAVARELGVRPSIVTRQIAQLEGHFGVRLLHRTTRRISLTNDGHLLARHACQIVENASTMERELGEHRTAPVGVVRLGAPTGPALFLAPRLPQLLSRHRGLSVDLAVCDQFCNMIEAQLDLVLGHVPIVDSSLVRRRIGVVSRFVVAAPNYLERYGIPTIPAELERHVCILQGDKTSGSVWNFRSQDGPLSVQVSGPLSTNNERAKLTMARSGCGIACLPEMQVRDDLRIGRLVRLMPAYEAEADVLYVAYPSRRHLALRTRVVLEFVVQTIGPYISGHKSEDNATQVEYHSGGTMPDNQLAA